MRKIENIELDGKAACTQSHYLVEHKDLPLSCPLREMRVWDAHPRVYLPIEECGEVVCPYCGAHYTLEQSEHPHE